MQLSSQVDLQEIIVLTNSTFGKTRRSITSQPNPSGLESFMQLQQSSTERLNIDTRITDNLDNIHELARQGTGTAAEPRAEYILKLPSGVEKYLEMITSDKVAIDTDKLIFNMGIVATHNHDEPLIEKAYEKLWHSLPCDTPKFLAEGIQQMDIIGYPGHVRAVVEIYYSVSRTKTLH